MAALLIPGLAFISALVLVAIANTANVQTKAQVESQGSILQFFKDAITGKAAVHAITTLTRAAVSRWALSSLRPVTAWFVALNALLLNIFRTQTETIEETAAAIEQTNRRIKSSVTYKDGSTVKTKAQTATKTAGQAKTAAHATSTSLHTYRVRTAPKIAHATHAVDVTIPGQLHGINTEVDRLSRDAKALRERTASLENGAVKTFEWIRTHPLSAVTGVFAGAVAVALQRMGYGALRCRSWKGLGRRLTCGMGAFLSDLLAIGFAYTVVVDPVAIAKAANAAEDSIDFIIRRIAD